MVPGIRSKCLVNPSALRVIYPFPLLSRERCLLEPSGTLCLTQRVTDHRERWDLGKEFRVNIRENFLPVEAVKSHSNTEGGMDSPSRRWLRTTLRCPPRSDLCHSFVLRLLMVPYSLRIEPRPRHLGELVLTAQSSCCGLMPRAAL